MRDWQTLQLPRLPNSLGQLKRPRFGTEEFSSLYETNASKEFYSWLNLKLITIFPPKQP